MDTRKHRKLHKILRTTKNTALMVFTLCMMTICIMSLCMVDSDVNPFIPLGIAAVSGGWTYLFARVNAEWFDRHDLLDIISSGKRSHKGKHEEAPRKAA